MNTFTQYEGGFHASLYAIPHMTQPTPFKEVPRIPPKIEEQFLWKRQTIQES